MLSFSSDFSSYLLTCLGGVPRIHLVLSPDERARVEQTRRTRPNAPNVATMHCGSREEGWTVDLLRDDVAQHQEAASDATVRRQRQAGGWVYTRFAQTVPRNAPTAEKKKPGWQKLLQPLARAKRNGR